MEKYIHLAIGAIEKCSICEKWHIRHKHQDYQVSSNNQTNSIAQ